MSLFNRKYLLTLSSTVNLPPDPLQPYTTSVAQGFEGVPRAVESFEVSELRVSATVKISENNSNSTYTEINIYNATEEIKSKLVSPDVYITLSAGYEKNILTGEITSIFDLPTIFSGDVVDSFTKKEGSDYITTIRAKDSEVAKRDSHISAMYIGGQTITYILEDIVNRFLPKVSLGKLELGPIFIPKQRLNNPYLAYGRVRDVLDELAADFGFIWYIVGNKFYAQPPNFGRAREFVEITPSDVIGDLTPANGTNHISSPEDAKAGLKFRVFLDGRIDLSKYIKITGFSEDNNGDYKVIDLQHSLDTRGQNWYTEITAEGI